MESKLKIDYFAYVPKRKAFYPIVQINFETGDCVIMSQKSTLRFVLKSTDYILIRNTKASDPGAEGCGR